MQGMPAQGRIVFLFLYPAGMEFFIFGGHVARRAFALLSRFSAFQYNVFSRHGKNRLSKGREDSAKEQGDNKKNGLW